MLSNRVIAGAIVLAGSLLASGLFVGAASAQYESVGKPLQLVPQAYSSASTATPRARVAAKKAAKAETRAEIRSETRSAARTEPKTETTQHISFRRKHPARTEVAEQRRVRRSVTVANAETPAPPRAALPLRAASTPAIPALAAQAAPAPAQPNTGELVVDGQAVQVRSPDEANELDMAANMASPPPPKAPAAAPVSAAAPSAKAPLYDLAQSSPSAPPAASDTPSTDAVVSAFVGTAAAAPIGPPAPAVAATVPAGNSAMVAESDLRASDPQAKSPVGSASWMMQVMAALGGAIAAGTAAWFLIGRASPRIKLSDWEEADGQA